MEKKDLVPVTGALLAFVQAFQAAKTMYIAESGMAESLGNPEPASWWDRCKELFFRGYAKQRDEIGLAANEITFRTLLDVELTPEVLGTDFDELPKLFVFDPWGGRGAIRRKT